MCGIAGYIGSNSLSEEKVQETLSLMKNRGPNHQDFTIQSNCDLIIALLHSRLSIIDLDERSNQPFCIEDCLLVYNGEIYNYLELKADLESQGVVFITSSDTEVLLRSYLHYGESFLDKLEGMWGFALYDRRQQYIILARDRFGEKPLYYWQQEQGLYFGSEIKFIQSLAGSKLGINYDHLFRYLVNGYKSLFKESHHFFQGLRQIRSGHYLKLDLNGNLEEKTYWNPSYQENDLLSREEVIEQTREKLIRSVQMRLRSDVPLAFCLSGGIDSNALVSIAKNVLDYDVHGFTIAIRDERYSEQNIVDQVVSEMGLKHDYVYLETTDFIDKLKKLILYHDSPVFTITAYTHWELMRAVESYGYKVCISGGGADEIFTGYYDHYNSYLAEVSQDPELFEKSLQFWEEHVKLVVRNPHLQNPRLFVENPDFRTHIFLNNDVFADYLKVKWKEDFVETKYRNGLLRNRMLNEMFHEVMPVILHEDDLNAMYYSIENRSPFLDRELFEFAQTMPTRYMMREGYNKVILRDALRGITPDVVLNNRRKVGFNAPIKDLLDVQDPKVKEYLLDDSPVYDHLKRSEFEKMLKKDHLLNSESKFLFYFLNSKIFIEEFGI